MNDGPLREMAYLLAEAFLEIALLEEQVKSLQDTIVDQREQLDEWEERNPV